MNAEVKKAGKKVAGKKVAGKKVAILVIHGMGSQNSCFAKNMMDKINQHVKNDWKKNPQHIAWKTIFWADVLKDRQDKYLERANEENKHNDTKGGLWSKLKRYIKMPLKKLVLNLRMFIVSNFGDASAYQETRTANTYNAIHARVRTAISGVYADVQSKNVPLLILAHSLGGHIMSNYIWDMQKAVTAKKEEIKPDVDLPEVPDNHFECMETLAGIVTFGCNIPLFTFAYSPVVPITFPTPKPNNVAGKQWINYYDADDILGYPLTAIESPPNQSPTYAATVEDIQINVGGFLSSWNPLSHLGYWTDNDFTKPVAKFIIKFL